MPKIDGREALRRLRRDDNWTPVILLTQVGESTERAMALEEGPTTISTSPSTRTNWWPGYALFCGALALTSAPWLLPGG